MHKVFAHKLKKYEELIEFYESALKIKEKLIVPMVVSVNGLVHRNTTELLSRKLRMTIDWNTTVRNILVRNMKDLMYYNGVNVSLENEEIESEEEEDDNNNNYLNDDEKLSHLFL